MLLVPLAHLARIADAVGDPATPRTEPAQSTISTAISCSRCRTFSSTAAIFFALATITRSMMAHLPRRHRLRLRLLRPGRRLRRSAAARRRSSRIAEPFGARALDDATRYWTVAERNVMLPDFAGALLYNRLLWIGISILFLALAYRRLPLRRPGDVETRAEEAEARSAAAPRKRRSTALSRRACRRRNHGNAATRALLWMRTLFEIKQVVLSPAFVVLMAWGLFVAFFVLIAQRDPRRHGRATRRRSR